MFHWWTPLTHCELAVYGLIQQTKLKSIWKKYFAKCDQCLYIWVSLNGNYQHWFSDMFELPDKTDITRSLFIDKACLWQSWINTYWWYICWFRCIQIGHMVWEKSFLSFLPFDLLCMYKRYFSIIHSICLSIFFILPTHGYTVRPLWVFTNTKQ